MDWFGPRPPRAGDVAAAPGAGTRRRAGAPGAPGRAWPNGGASPGSCTTRCRTAWPSSACRPAGRRRPSVAVRRRCPRPGGDRADRPAGADRDALAAGAAGRRRGVPRSVRRCPGWARSADLITDAEAAGLHGGVVAWTAISRRFRPTVGLCGYRTRPGSAHERQQARGRRPHPHLESTVRPGLPRGRRAIDDGGVAREPAGAGRGLAGLRERVACSAGTLEAGRSTAGSGCAPGCRGRPPRERSACCSPTTRTGPWRAGAVLSAEDDLEVVGQAGDGPRRSTWPAAAGRTWCCSTSGCLAWTGWRRPGGSWVPDEPPKVVVLTTFDLDEYVFDAFRAGVSGFLLKDAPRARHRRRHPRRRLG